MLGAIIGDIVGSRFEFNNHKSKNFDLFTSNNHITDDTIMTLAIAKSIYEYKNGANSLRDQVIYNMKDIGRRYFDCGFGGFFARWIATDDTAPYNSYGNGAAMRVSACGYMTEDMNEAMDMSDIVTAVTHDHPEALKAAAALTEAIWMARHKKKMRKIQKCIYKSYYPQHIDLDKIRPSYHFDVTCQGTMPVAFEAFFASTSFEDAIRNAISVGGDSDTIAAITGSLAGAYYDIPNDIREKALTYLPDELLNILLKTEELIHQ